MRSRILSDLLNALAGRINRLRRGGKRTQLAKLFIRLFVFLAGIEIIMEAFDFHIFGKARAMTSRIAVGIGLSVSLLMLWLLSGDNGMFNFPDENNDDDDSSDT